MKATDFFKAVVGAVALPFVIVVSFVLYVMSGDFVEPVKVGK